MPPKPKFTKEEIVQTALEVVSQKGAAALTAQELANALGSSARPIFTVFRTMQEVQDAVREAAMRRFETFAAQKLPDMPLFKQVGMQMVLFGAKEPKLYQLLFMQENRSAASFDDVFGALGPTAQTCIELLQAQYDLSSRMQGGCLKTSGSIPSESARCVPRGCAASAKKRSGRCSPPSFRQCCALYRRRTEKPKNKYARRKDAAPTPDRTGFVLHFFAKKEEQRCMRYRLNESRF